MNTTIDTTSTNLLIEHQIIQMLHNLSYYDMLTPEFEECLKLLPNFNCYRYAIQIKYLLQKYNISSIQTIYDNPDLYLDIISEYLDIIQWDYKMISKSNSIHVSFLRESIHKNWDFKELSNNIHIHELCDLAFEYPEKPWDFNIIYENMLKYSNLPNNKFNDSEYLTKLKEIIDTNKLSVLA